MTNQTKVQHIKQTNQMVTTIPSTIAGAIRLKKGDTLEWLFERGDVVIRKI